MARDLIKIESIAERRAETLEKANDALKAKLGWIIEWQQTETSRGIVGRWDLGEEIAEIYDDFNKNGARTYGKASKKAVALFLGEDPSIVNMALKLYRAWPDRKRIVEITEMLMVDRVTPLSYSHIRQLLAINDPQVRHELMNECLEQCWTSAELGVEVQKINGGKQTNNPNGRGVSVPKGVDAVIGQMIGFADDFETRNVKVWKHPEHSVPTQVEKLGQENYSEALAKKLGELAHRMRQLATEAAARAEEAERQYAEVKKYLKGGTVKKAAELVKDLESEERQKRGARPVGRRVKVSA